jgi:hypothetical protein
MWMRRISSPDFGKSPFGADIIDDGSDGGEFDATPFVPKVNKNEPYVIGEKIHLKHPAPSRGGSSLQLAQNA